MSDLGKSGERVFRGIPVSAGVCRGKIFVLSKPPESTVPRYTISDSEVPEHVSRLEQALLQTRIQIHQIQDRLKRALESEDTTMFDAQLLVLDDPDLLGEVRRCILHQRLNVEYAFWKVSQKYLEMFSTIKDDFYRERVVDMRDVISRILQNLTGREHESDLSQITEPCIVGAFDLTPSQTALLDKSKVLGFATDQGSKTSHSAILARSLELPAVTGLQDVSQRLQTGQYALLDGYNGLLILNPTDQTLFEYGQLARRHLAIRERLTEVRDQSAVTLDGVRIVLSANLENPAETVEVQSYGAEGVGLYRTEYLFMNRNDLPSEEEQFNAYHRVATVLNPQPVIIRTLDLGGDKVWSHRNAPQELNPFLGWRAIRICLVERDLFRAQLRAILRASALGNIKMMYPMISGLDELSQANEAVEQCKAELRAEGKPFNEQLEIGVMIEIPAAAMVADALARRVRFFSIGTNDLIQYTLAVDRQNPKITHLYEPTHPAVLRLIKMTVDAAHANGIWVGVCGEMAGDPILAALLLGLGADELSVAPALVPAVKYVIRRLKISEARDLAKFGLASENGGEVLARAQQLVESIAPDLFETRTETSLCSKVAEAAPTEP